MSHQAPVHVIHIGRPQNADGTPMTNEGTFWLDDGSTPNADDGDICIIKDGQIRVFKQFTGP